jgi:Bacterial membrane protein YfhO
MNGRTDARPLPSLTASGIRAAHRGLSAWWWAAVTVLLAAIPLAPGLTSDRIFYVRDLSMYFWGRFLWLRRTLLGGEWPLWDPYVGAGQSAVADSLHQMFLLPVLLLRVIGSEVLAFNLWVALPFPIAAVGAWLFFARRFSPAASALAGVVFALAGPVISSGNFPNMSWSVAMMPWLLWGVDRVARSPSARSIAVLTLLTAAQALTGEPVTFACALVLAAGYTLFVTGGDDHASKDRLRRWGSAAAGLILGSLLAAIQLLPMVRAASDAERSKVIIEGVWSLHPLALVETVAPRVFGDYFVVPSLANVPWLALVNTGREPFFFSMYVGVPVFAVALYGMVAVGRSSWSVFWAAAGATGVICAFGMYTPVYPFLQNHLPVLGSFRFPVKYLVVLTLAVAAGVAAGWDAILASGVRSDIRTVARARLDAVGFAVVFAVAAAALAAACIYLPGPTATKLSALARGLHSDDARLAAEYMLRVLPRMMSVLMLVSLTTAVLLSLATSQHPAAPTARWMLFAIIAIDVVSRAWGVNPVFPAERLAEPAWLTLSKADPNARFYVGGKKDGTLEVWDIDAAMGYLNAPGLVGSASRAALSAQAAYYPSGWHGREMLSYDLALLWPKPFKRATDHFFEGSREQRDRFLDRTGVRYRVMPDRLAGGRRPIAQVPYFYKSSFYDWDPNVAPRVNVVEQAMVIAGVDQQIDALFKDGWDRRTTVIVNRESALSGVPGPPVAPFARIAHDGANRVVVHAGAGAGGGYLVFLDSFADDWHVVVDDHAAQLLRANGLFRAVRLAPGTHMVDFRYRPRAFIQGAVISSITLIVVIGLIWAPWPRRA